MAINKSGLVRTSRGSLIDMNRLAKDNGDIVAITAGGVSMNARGDILGSGGRIIKTREELERAYYQENKKAAKHVESRQVSIKKTNISPDNLPEEKKIRMEKPEKRKTVVPTETFTVDDLAAAMEVDTPSTRKRRTPTDD